MKGILSIGLLVAFVGGSLTGAFAQNLSPDTVNNVMSSTWNNLTAPLPVMKPKIKKPKPIRSEFSFGFRLNTDGWSVFADKGYVRSEDRQSDYFYNVRLFQVEFGEKKHPKEIKRSNNLGSSYGEEKAKPFVFGKINNFYNLKLGYGARKMIAGKPEHGTVSIHWVYLGGLTVGIEKPYYVEAYVPQDNFGTLIQQTIKYSEETKESFLTRQYIIGSAGFGRGLNEVKVVPGIHAKTGLHFDFATSKKSKLAIETGVSAELYTRKIELMANQDAVPYFTSIYASFQFGKRK